MAEIREVARRQLAQTGAAALSLRAVAREMGLTAPALYRYYDDRDALLTALIVEAYQGLNAALERARDAVPPDDPGARVIAACLALRAWAVARPHEFALVFGAPVPGYAAPLDGPTHEVGAQFGGIFLTLFAELHARTAFPLPPADRLTPALADELGTPDGFPGPSLPPAAMQVFLGCWSTLHGAISLELFGHLHWVGVTELEVLYRSQVAVLLDRLGVDGTRVHEQPAPPALAPSA